MKVTLERRFALIGGVTAAILILAGAALAITVSGHGLRSTSVVDLPVKPVEMPSPDALPGAALSTRLTNSNAFAQSAPGLTFQQRRDFFFGNRLFNTNWAVAPGSVVKFDGLGPTFNRVSCSGCHTRDGRGRPPLNDEKQLDSMLIRISDGQGNPLPHYGDQFNDRANHGIPAEGRVEFHWETQKGEYADGTPYTLGKPVFKLVDLNFGPLGEDVRISPRVASEVYGVGLLEAVPEKEILAWADPDDEDGDGISGRANYQPDPETGEMLIGRFGWKANQPTLRAQNSGAAAGDIGITSPVHPDENCPPAQTACAEAPKGDHPDLSEEFLRKLTHYTRVLAVPVRRKPKAPDVMKGSRIFADIGCAACHRPSMTTGKNTALDILNDQIFHAYTDLLLHDMGPELADNRPDVKATGAEWRTPPLWGLGLLPVVNGHLRLLHDGRADGFAEAILWHGGEAQASKERFRRLSEADRAALIAFLKSI